MIRYLKTSKDKTKNIYMAESLIFLRNVGKLPGLEASWMRS